MNNELDELTRYKMNKINLNVFNGEFYIYLLMILIIFGLGFVSGNIAHDSCCHAIEQLQK